MPSSMTRQNDAVKQAKNRLQTGSGFAASHHANELVAGYVALRRF